MMNETLKTMWTRRSIRKYKSDSIPEKDLHLILEAARRAPTGANRQNWRMIVITDPDLRKRTAEACNNQMWMADAQVNFVITAEYSRATVKYGKRGVRYAMIEAGHIGQNLFLQAETMGLKAGIVGAFHDNEVIRVMNNPFTHEPLLIMPVGYPA